MGNVRWRGDAQAVANVWTITVSGTWATADTGTLTVNGKDLVLTAGTDVTTAAIATALKEMWNGDAQSGTGDHTFSETGNNIPEMSGITATVSGSVVTLSAETAGVPFTVSESASTAGTGDLAAAEATAATGPNHWDNAENWDTGSAPAASDNVYIENSDVDILYGLDQNTITLTSLNIAASYSGRIGLPDRNPAGYWEYSDKYLKISASTINVGNGPGPGSPRIKLNIGSVQTTLSVNGTGASSEQGLEAMLFIGTHANNTVNITRGSVGIAVEAGQTATVLVLNCSYQQSQASDVQARLGSGVTLATVNQTGGVLEINSAFTTLNMTGGTTTLKGSGNITTLNLDGGTVIDQNSGIKTTVNVGAAVLDHSRTLLGTTYTGTNLYRGASLLDPFKKITFTFSFTIVRCGLGDLAKLDLGDNFSLQRS